MFHPEKHDKPKNSSLASYQKVVFKSTLGDTVVVYLEEINDSDFRVSAIFVADNRGERYSYRDYCFKHDYDDQSGGGNGGTTIANFLSYQHHCSDKIDIKSMSINDTPDTINKKKIQPIRDTVYITFFNLHISSEEFLTNQFIEFLPIHNITNGSSRPPFGRRLNQAIQSRTVHVWISVLNKRHF